MRYLASICIKTQWIEIVPFGRFYWKPSGDILRVLNIYRGLDVIRKHRLGRWALRRYFFVLLLLFYFNTNACLLDHGDSMSFLIRSLLTSRHTDAILKRSYSIFVHYKSLLICNRYVSHFSKSGQHFVFTARYFRWHLSFHHTIIHVNTRIYTSNVIQ